ncbi:MAG: hypothetical protein CR982_03310 [Candidatus Cloacimonadota bacterium]|nr:MAG: hypothetical protein CR982_03310 [Candidatus Cloacimonadota bacterium]
MKKKFLFLYLKTGGGHLSTARSIEECILSSKEDVEIILADGLNNGNKFMKSIIEEGYRLSQSIALWVYEILYGIHKIKTVSKLTSNFVASFVRDEIFRLIKLHNPEKIVIFHFFLVDPVLKVLKELNLNIPVLTVVTDPYTAHPMWFLHNDQNYVVFSRKVLENSAKKMGVPEENINIFPYILNEKFRVSDINKLDKIRSKYGFDNGKKLILIIGGGDGIPKGEKIVKNLVNFLPDIQYAVVCGRDKKLFNKIKTLSKENNLIKVFEYIDFVSELMSVSDLVISKCGPATFMEILLSKKIPIISSYIWEQEKGNVDFIVENKFGIYEKKVKKLPHIVNELLSNEDLYNSFLNNINKADLQNGVESVSEFIYNY